MQMEECHCQGIQLRLVQGSGDMSTVREHQGSHSVELMCSLLYFATDQGPVKDTPLRRHSDSVRWFSFAAVAEPATKNRCCSEHCHNTDNKRHPRGPRAGTGYSAESDFCRTSGNNRIRTESGRRSAGIRKAAAAAAGNTR